MSSGNSLTAAKPSMAAMGVQTVAQPATDAQARARYFNSANAFNVKLPAVPARLFDTPARAAMAADSPTGLYDCDQSSALGCAMPATTPLMLARYARINAGDTLSVDLRASGALWYVIAGAGTVTVGEETLAWAPGDVLALPGGALTWRAGGEAAVLWSVSDEPLLAQFGLQAHPALATTLQPVHCPGADIAAQLLKIHATEPDPGTSGMALVFSSDTLIASRNIHPTLTLSLNTLPPQSLQSSHRHNAAALTLVVSGEKCFSTVDGQAHDWTPWATLVTPAGAPHSHHNAGPARADFLIVQDGGLHYHTRTMDFTFLGA